MPAASLRRLVGTALASLALATAACGGDGDATGPGSAPAPAPTDVTGSYALTGLRSPGHLRGGGNGLPVTFTDDGGSRLTFSGGELILGADGSYSLEVEARFNNSNVTMSDEGTYSVTGDGIAFHPTGSPARMKNGTISGNSITAATQFGGIPFEIQVRK